MFILILNNPYLNPNFDPERGRFFRNQEINKVILEYIVAGKVKDQTQLHRRTALEREQSGILP